ncbi:MAG: Maf family protein [Deferrisomatales bacterium]
MPRLILASASPRRRELLSRLDVPFDVVPSRADEALPEDLSLRPALETVALRKAAEVGARAPEGCSILAADTAVVLGDRVFGKPRDRREARTMLASLSGRTHQVITAVAFLGPDLRRTLSVATDVTFRALSPAQIDWYTGLEEPYDKAGAYAVQGRGAFLVASLSGSYTNVVGLPMAETVRLLEEAGLTPWSARIRREAAHG